MKAKIGKPVQNTKQYWEKEKTNYWHVMVIHKGKIEHVVTAYCWMGRSTKASTVYANLWVHGSKATSGSGSAGGGGYDKESAAVQDAITSAGITLWGDVNAVDGIVPRWNTQSKEPEDLKKKCFIDGVGERAIRDALTAIARAAGYRGHLVIV